MTRGLAILVGAFSAASLACTDPVRDAQIESLGGEDPEIPIGPEHRAGQPCVLCHSEGGPASGAPFAVGGTVYETGLPGSPGAPGIVVKFVDGRRNGPRTSPRTGPSGNFYVPAVEWDVVYPFTVGIYREGQVEPVQVMQSLVNREPSCSACHATNLTPPFSDAERERNKREVGQIYVRGGS